MAREDVTAGRIKQARGKAENLVGAARGKTSQQIKGKAQELMGKAQEKLGRRSK